MDRCLACKICEARLHSSIKISSSENSEIQKAKYGLILLLLMGCTHQDTLAIEQNKPCVVVDGEKTCLEHSFQAFIQ